MPVKMTLSDGRAPRSVGRAVDVGLLHFERVVGSDLDALQRGGMDYDLDALHRAPQPVPVAHIGDEEAKALIRIERAQLARHLRLAMFSPGEDHEGAGGVIVTYDDLFVERMQAFINHGENTGADTFGQR